jgi:DNA-binding transcriptional regulator YdaS (Cro superfamily)
MEQLRAYLSGRRKAEFARQVGIVPPYLSQILSGGRRPSLDLMARIDRATSGAVPLSAWLKDETEAAQ